jgi:hypothetical protein
MLSNDSAQAQKSSAFYLVVHAHAVAELAAECPKCGAITSYGLELAWRLRTVTCSECLLAMRIGADDLTALRERLIEARVRIDRLISGQPATE